MKKKILIYLLAFVCLFGIKNVYADTYGCERVSDPWTLATSIKLHDTTRKNYSVGDKVYVDLYGLPNDAPINVEVRLDSINAEKVTDVRVYLKNLEGNGSSSGKAYFIIPDSVKPGEQYEVARYVVFKTTNEKYLTSYGEQNKIVCAFFTTNKDKQNSGTYMNVTGSVTQITISEKGNAEGDPVANVADSELKDISMDKTSGYLGGKLKFKVSLTKPIDKVLVSLYDKYSGRYISGYLKNYDKTATDFEGELDIPTSAYTTTYALYSVQLQGENSYRIYQTGTPNIDPHFAVLNLDKTIWVTIGESINNILSETGIVIGQLKFEKTKDVQGATIPVDLNVKYGTATITRDMASPKITIRSLLLNFVSESGEDMFSTYIKGLKAKTSFVIPSSAKYGTYKLKSVVATLDSYVGETNNIIFNDSMTYGEYANIFSQTLTVEKGEPESYLYFVADKLDQEVVEMIKDSKEDAIITVSAEEQSVIPAEVFDAIKETQRQLIVEYNKNEWVFNGTDVVDAKAVDVSMKFYEVSELENLDKIKSALGDNSIVVEFPENGSLPGKALIRIKDSEVSEKLKGDKLYIYHIDEKNNKLNKVAYELQKSYDGYIEFYINHNSKYVITSEEVKDDSIVGKDDDAMKVNSIATTGEKSSTDNTILYVALGISAAVIVILLVALIARKPKKVEQAPVATEEPKTEEPVKEEPKAEEPAQEEAPVEENKTE